MKIFLLVTLLSSLGVHGSYHYLEYADPALPGKVIGGHEVPQFYDEEDDPPIVDTPQIGPWSAHWVDAGSDQAVKVQHFEDYTLRTEPVGGNNILPLTGTSWTACEPDHKCGRCEGDCDEHADCEEGLICFFRSGYEEVLGCSGAGRSGMDYCYDPNLHPTSGNTLELPLEGDDGDWNRCEAGQYECGRCEGDCDSDSDCAPGLLCFLRDDVEDIPGCIGPGEAEMDYCYDPDGTQPGEGDTLCLDTSMDVSFQACVSPPPDNQKWYFETVPGEADTYRLRSAESTGDCEEQYLDDRSNFDAELDTEEDNSNPASMYVKIDEGAFQW